MRSVIPNQLTEPPDPARRRCYDCRHMKGAVSWWCTNEAAVEAHRTRMPGRHDCPFWAPGAWPPPTTTRREPVPDGVFVVAAVMAAVIVALVLGTISSPGDARAVPENIPERSP
jgi:hypothetical protein